MDLYRSSKSDEWSTPPGFAEQYGPFDLDPCADASNARAPKFFSREEDGLSRPWFGRVWMNPPYGRQIGKWIAKALHEVTCGNCESVVCLLPARTDTAWWHDYCTFGEIEFIRGRLKFGGSPHDAPFPCAVVTFDSSRRPDG